MEKLYRLNHEIQFKNTIFTIIYIYQCVIKNNSKRLLFFTQEVNKSAANFRGVFYWEKANMLIKKQRPQHAANFFRILLKLNFRLIANQVWNQYQWNDKLALNKNALGQ